MGATPARRGPTPAAFGLTKRSGAANAHPGFWEAERSAQVTEEPATRAEDTEQNASPPRSLTPSPVSPQVVFVLCGKITRKTDLGLMAVLPGSPLLTEALQNFASHRDASWQDVGVDLAGAVVGVVLARVGR